MKKFSLLFAMLAIFTFALTACGSNGGENAVAYEPVDINPDTDVCVICAMAVADDQHATQIVLQNERVLKFDDLGCLYGWVEQNGRDNIGAEYVRDFNTQEWIALEDATYVFDEKIETPMAYGIISFKETADAEKYIEENGFGELLKAADLNDHKWEMMNHDHHDHGHHEDHNEHESHEESNGHEGHEA